MLSALWLACAGAPGVQPDRALGGAAGVEGRSEPLGRRAAALLTEAIRFRTDSPEGPRAGLARFLVARLRAEGVEAALIEIPAAGAGGPRAAVWGRVRGTGRARPVVLLSHLDVVPADPAAWSVDPFLGEVKDGFVYGRGALDAKGVAVVHLLTLVELSRRPHPLDRDVILLATPDEETGGREGAGWLARERLDLFRGAEYLLTEGGGIRNVRGGEGGPREIWNVAVTEKAPCWLALVAKGNPGHSSAPRRDAAVPRLIAALDRIRRFESGIRVVPEVEQMFRTLARVAPAEDQAGYLHLRDALSKDRSFRRRFLANHGHNALVRNTISITVLQGGSRTNVAPGRARAHLDMRLLPGERCGDFEKRVVEVIGDPEIGIERLLDFPSRASPADTKLFETLENIARQSHSRALVVPRVLTGFTDAHWFRERGIIAYGFVPRWLSAQDARGIHGPDERISLTNLEQGIRTLVKILEQL